MIGADSPFEDVERNRDVAAVAHHGKRLVLARQVGQVRAVRGKERRPTAIEIYPSVRAVDALRAEKDRAAK